MEEDKRNDEVFMLYGKFLINFEHVCHVMRTSIVHLLFPKNQHKEMRQTEILMESLTADQVRNKFIALIAEEFDDSSSAFKLAKTISKVYEKMIPIRNSFAHGTSFIGKSSPLEDAEDGLLILKHPKLRKTGLDLNFKRYEINTLKLGIQLFERLVYAVAVVTISVINKNSMKIYADGYTPDKHHEGLAAELLRYEKKLGDYLNK